MTIIAISLTSHLSAKLKELTGEDYFYFYDVYPNRRKDSIDMNKVYLKSRYDKGEPSKCNCNE